MLLAVVVLLALSGSDRLTIVLAAAAWLSVSVPAIFAARHAREAVRQAHPPSNAVTNGYYAENSFFLLQQLVDLWRAERGYPPLNLPHPSEVYGRRISDGMKGDTDARDDHDD